MMGFLTDTWSSLQAWPLHFLRPAWLLACPVLIVLAYVLSRRQTGQARWATLIDPELLSALQLHDGQPSRKGKTRVGRGGKTQSPWGWLALAWSLAAVALSGPSWEQAQSAAYRTQDAWVIVLDLSPSMAATDLTPTRATRARYAIDDLLGAAKGARVGMVVFSDDTYTVTPLTDDTATIKALLPPLAPDIMPSPGDHLAPALVQAQQLLDRAGVKGGHVIVLSDGVEDQAAALAAASTLKQAGTSLDIVAMGTAQGAPVRGADGAFVQDAQGHPQMARMDQGLLDRLARAGGGRAVSLKELPSLMADLQTPLPTDAQQIDGVQTTHWLDSGFWLLPPLLLLVALLGRRGWL